MDRFSATDAALAGFRVAREKPKAILVWALIMAVLSFGVAAAAAASFGDKLTALQEVVSSQSDPDPQAMMAMMGPMWPLFIGSMVYVLITNSVLLAAVNRLVLRPHDNKAAYLRLGMDELRQAVVQVLLYVILCAAYFVGVVVLAVLAGIGAAIGGKVLGIFLGVLSFFAVVGGLIFLSLRLSFVSTLAFDTRRIDLKGSWKMTEGKAWPLFGTYAVAAILAFVVYLLLLVIILAVTAAFGGLNAAGDALQQDINSLASVLSPGGVVRALLSGLMSVLLSLIVFAPAPSLYALFKGRDEVETFS
ncbi:MAG: hypothetical protein J7521_16290 [Caulobacter sp.]|nr:hypothetical protein [Caulobacter sp.]